MGLRCHVVCRVVVWLRACVRACVSACVRACVRGLLRAAAAQIQGAGQWRNLASGKNPVREKNPLETACDLHSIRREKAKKPSPRKKPSLGFFLKSLLNHREILGFFFTLETSGETCDLPLWLPPFSNLLNFKKKSTRGSTPEGSTQGRISTPPPQREAQWDGGQMGHWDETRKTQGFLCH